MGTLFHFHSHYSDGYNSVNAIATRARKLNIGVAITDHNEIKGAVELEKYGCVLNIPGIEITSVEGTHLLVYFYEIDSFKVDQMNRDPRKKTGLVSALKGNNLSRTKLNISYSGLETNACHTHKVKNLVVYYKGSFRFRLFGSD